jgi:hypothetical protein
MLENVRAFSDCKPNLWEFRQIWGNIDPQMRFVVIVTQKGTYLHQIASFEPSKRQNWSTVRPVDDSEKIESKKVTKAASLSYCGSQTRGTIVMVLGLSQGFIDIINYAKYCIDRPKGSSRTVSENALSN